MIATYIGKLLGDYLVDHEDYNDSYGIVFNLLIHLIKESKDVVFEIIGTIFSWFLSAVSQFFAVILAYFMEALTASYSQVVKGGKSILTYLFSFTTFDGGVFSTDFLYFFVGLLFFSVTVRLIIKLITAIIGIL